MINPYINYPLRDYPFVPESVNLLARYTAEANAQDMRVKFFLHCKGTHQPRRRDLCAPDARGRGLRKLCLRL